MNPKSYSGQRSKITALTPARVTEPRCRRCYSQSCSSPASGPTDFIVFKQFIIPIVRATSYNVSQRIMELDGHFYEERNFILRFLTFLLLSNQNIASIWKRSIIIRHTGKWELTLRRAKEKTQLFSKSELSNIDRVDSVARVDMFLSQRQDSIIGSC